MGPHMIVVTDREVLYLCIFRHGATCVAVHIRRAVV